MLRRILIPFAAISILAAAAFQYNWVRFELDRRDRETIENQWRAMKGYLRLDYDQHQRVAGQWYYDADDPGEDAFVSRIRGAYLVAGRQGDLLHASALLQDLGVSARPEIIGRMRQADSSGTSAFWIDRRNARGLSYLVRAGIVYDEHHRSPYYVAIAAPVPRYVRGLTAFFGSLAVLICGAVLLGLSLRRGVSRFPV